MDKFWAGGNRDFGDVNFDLRYDTAKKLTDADYDINNTWDYDLTDEENYNELLDILHSYFPESVDHEEEFLDLIEEFSGCRSQDENEIICKVLEFKYGEPFVTGDIQGNGQGDWMEYICPASMSQESINYIEAVLFNSGTEFSITEDMLDLDGLSEDEKEEAFARADKFSDYTYLWRDEDIKEWIAKNMHCKPEEVELLEGEY